MSHIYLDANSTTRLDDRVREVMIDCLAADYVNPASQHQPGQAARRRLEVARSSLVRELGATPRDRLVFTSGGTEANNLAVIGLANGLLSQVDPTEPPEIIISAIEHPSVLGAADFLSSRGFVVRTLPVDPGGQVCVDRLRDLIVPQTRLVSLMLVNNETGVIQDLSIAAEICRDFDVLLHCDAVQAVGKIGVNFRDLGVSAMTVTAHKLHGPNGIGGLLLAEGVDLQPMMFGGSQQLGQRPGTENVVMACGFAEAVTLATSALSERQIQMRELRDLLEATILDDLPDAIINGVDRPRAPHTSNISFPGSEEFATVNRQALLMAVDAAGVAVSTGSACASGSSEPSHVLTAMGVSQDVIESSIRVSLSTRTTRRDVLEGARRILNAAKHLRQQKSGRK